MAGICTRTGREDAGGAAAGAGAVPLGLPVTAGVGGGELAGAEDVAGVRCAAVVSGDAPRVLNAISAAMTATSAASAEMRRTPARLMRPHPASAALPGPHR